MENETEIIAEVETVYSEFNCPTYTELSAIPFKLCIGRHLAKTPYGQSLYPECAHCVKGENILKKFGDYTFPKKKKAVNWNTTQYCVKENEKRKSFVINCTKCKSLLQAQIDYVIQLIYQERQLKAVERLEVLLSEIGGI